MGRRTFQIQQRPKVPKPNKSENKKGVGKEIANSKCDQGGVQK